MWAAHAKTKTEIVLPEWTIPQGKEVTITLGRNEKYAIWCWAGVYDLPEHYIDEGTIKQFTTTGII
jgi:hypothetical protein